MAKKKSKRKFKTRRFNKKVFWFSIIALACLALGFLVHWIFIVPAVVFMIINQKELFKKGE